MIPAAGALLVSTIMVLPASIAMRLADSFKGVILTAIGVGFVGMLLGIILSYYWETPASATITIIFVVMFLLVSLLDRLIKDWEPGLILRSLDAWLARVWSFGTKCLFIASGRYLEK